jgi:uncharacterized protein
MNRADSSVEEAQVIALRLVRRHIPDPSYRVFLFGSRTRGSARANSDIDLGVEGPAPIPYGTLVAIREDLENAPTLYTVDVVDFRRVPEKFRQVARERRYLEPERA